MPEDHDSPTENAPGGPFARLRGALARGPRRTRVIVRSAAAVLALVVFVGLPAFFASRPEFVRRYPKLDAQYRSWQVSEHVKAPCRSCHVPPGALAQTGFVGRMLGEFYLSIITRPDTLDEFPVPTTEACSSCHMELRAVSPAGDLNIPHRAHVDVLGIPCVRCHAGLAHSKGTSGTGKPTMEACLTCHDGVQAKDSCSACHTDKAAPASHRAADWSTAHPERLAGDGCEKCHKWRDDWCADCHTRRPKSHVKNWRTVHRDRVATHRNCEACHEAAFCVRCHGEVPSLDFDPALKRVR